MKHNTSWGKVADWYDDYLGGEDSYQKNVILPNLTRIVGAREGVSIADVACGQGYFSEIFAEKGARVIGVDISAELVRKAEGRATDKKLKQLEYFVSPSDNLSMIQSASIHTATCVLAAQNIKDIDTTIKEVSRILKRPKKLDTVSRAIRRHTEVKESSPAEYGRFILVLNHPMFRIPQESDWHFEDKAHSPHKDKQGRVVYQYLSEGTMKIDMNPGIPKERIKEKKYTISYHRPLQVFMKMLAKHGFALTRIEEWSSHKTSQEGPRAKAENTARKEIPLFMCIEACLIK